MVERRNHKIKSDFGISDFYKYYRENGGTLDHKTYKSILTTFHDRVADLLIETEYAFKLPCRMGILTIYRITPKVIIKDGKVVTNLAINFKATNELWESDPEAKKNKTKIYHENKHSNRYRYKFNYSTVKANFKNKHIYRFRVTRTNKYKLRDYIFEHGELPKTEKIKRNYGNKGKE